MSPNLNVDKATLNEILTQMAPGLQASIAMVILGPAGAHFFKMEVTDPAGETRKFGVFVTNEMTSEVLVGTIQGLVSAAQLGQGGVPASRLIRPS